MNEKQWTMLANDMRRALSRVAPAWTDHDSQDPGITMLEAMAWVIESLRYRQSRPDPRAGDLVQRIAAGAAALATPPGDDCGPGLERVVFFPGRLIDADDLNAEQQYLHQRWRRLNRALHGAGVVQGLEVSVEADGAGSRVVIAPGLAFDPAGNEVAVCEPAALALPQDGAALFVLLRYAERPCRPAPIASAAPTDGDTAMVPTRIVETFEAQLAAASASDAVAVGRVRRPRGRWRVDAAHAVPRVRRG